MRFATAPRRSRRATRRIAPTTTERVAATVSGETPLPSGASGGDLGPGEDGDRRRRADAQRPRRAEEGVEDGRDERRGEARLERQTRDRREGERLRHDDCGGRDAGDDVGRQPLLAVSRKPVEDEAGALRVRVGHSILLGAGTDVAVTLYCRPSPLAALRHFAGRAGVSESGKRRAVGESRQPRRCRGSFTAPPRSGRRRRARPSSSCSSSSTSSSSRSCAHGSRSSRPRARSPWSSSSSSECSSSSRAPGRSSSPASSRARRSPSRSSGSIGGGDPFGPWRVGASCVTIGLFAVVTLFRVFAPGPITTHRLVGRRRGLPPRRPHVGARLRVARARAARVAPGRPEPGGRGLPRDPLLQLRDAHDGRLRRHPARLAAGAGAREPRVAHRGPLPCGPDRAAPLDARHGRHAARRRASRPRRDLRAASR